MEAWCSLLTTAFFVPVLPMHCVSGWPRPKTAGTKVAWHDVAVSRTQTFKQNIFAGHLFSSHELLSKRLEKQQYDGCLSGQKCRHRGFTVMLCDLPAHSSVACCPTMYHWIGGYQNVFVHLSSGSVYSYHQIPMYHCIWIRMCLFNVHLTMFTVTTWPWPWCCPMYHCFDIRMCGSGDVYRYRLTMTMTNDHDHDHDVVQCIIASMFVHLSSGDVYNYHLTMTMMLCRMFRMCLFWGCLLLPPDTLVASVTMTKSGSSLPPQSNSDAILSQAKSVPQRLQLYIKHPQY